MFLCQFVASLVQGLGKYSPMRPLPMAIISRSFVFMFFFPITMVPCYVLREHCIAVHRITWLDINQVQHWISFLVLSHSIEDSTSGQAKVMGILSTIALLFKHGKRDDLVTYGKFINSFFITIHSMVPLRKKLKSSITTIRCSRSSYGRFWLHGYYDITNRYSITSIVKSPNDVICNVMTSLNDIPGWYWC